MYYLAKFFVDEPRKNAHKFNDPKEEFSALIYNTPPTDTRNVMSVYTQIYFEDFSQTLNTTIMLIVHGRKIPNERGYFYFQARSRAKSS
jgi:hypothetical protein